MPSNQILPRIGLALSGGTLKAAAHIGVLDALEKLNIRPDFIAGTSAGAFVGTLYAHGYTIPELRQLVDRFPGPSLFDYGFPLLSSLYNLLRVRLKANVAQQFLTLPRGLLLGNRLEAYFRRSLRHRSPRLPYAVVATDLYSGTPVVFSNHEKLIEDHGAVLISDVVPCLRGSCALPGVLTPVSLEKWLLVDGALRHYVPVEVLRQAGCDKIIVVNLNQLESAWHPTTLINVLTRSFDILLEETMEDDLAGEDVFLLQPDVSKVTWVSFSELHTCLNAGLTVVEQQRDALVRFLHASPPRQPNHTIRLRPLA